MNPDKNVVENQEYATLENGPKVRTDVDNGLTSIRLASSCFLQPNSKTQVLVSSRMMGLIVTEPKGPLFVKYGFRAMNSDHEVRENKAFTILLSNVSRNPRRLQKRNCSCFRLPLADRTCSSHERRSAQA